MLLLWIGSDVAGLFLFLDLLSGVYVVLARLVVDSVLERTHWLQLT